MGNYSANRMVCKKSAHARNILVARPRGAGFIERCHLRKCAFALGKQWWACLLCILLEFDDTKTRENAIIDNLVHKSNLNSGVAINVFEWGAVTIRHMRG